MAKLKCENLIRKLLETAANGEKRNDLVDYVNSQKVTPSWDLLFLTQSSLRKKYWESFVALHRELVPNYISADDLYTKFWELFKGVVNETKTDREVNNFLREFCEKVKKPLQQYEIIYEIRNFDIGESKFTYRNVEIFKMTGLYLDQISEETGTKDLKDKLNKWVDKTVAKTVVDVSDSERAFSSGLEVINALIDTIRITAVWGKINRFDDEMFLWDIGTSITIPKVQPKNGTSLIESFHRKFQPLVIPMDDAIAKALKNKKVLQHLLDGEFPEDIKNRLFKANKWISNAITSSNMDLKIVYLCTALEILLLPDHTKGRKGELLALRQVLVGHGSSYVPEAILHLYEKRCDIIHTGNIEITSYSDYRYLLDCCIDVLLKIISLSKRNPTIEKLPDLLKIVENEKTLQDFIDNCENRIFEGEAIKKIKESAENQLRLKRKYIGN